MIDPDLGLEADSILGFLGVGLFAYGIGGRHFGVAATGAIIAGWWGGLALARVGGLVNTINNLASSVGTFGSMFASSGSSSTTSTNGAGSGTP